METAGEVLSYRSKRGTQREYETTIIVKPSMGKPAILDLVKRIQDVFGSEGARLLSVENWGLRTLAYPIKAQPRGIYLYLRYLGGSGAVAELERNFRIWEDVVRYMTVRTDDDVDPNARPDGMTEDLLEAAGDTGEDPLEVARREEEARRKAEEEEAARAAEAAAAARAAAAAEAEEQAAPAEQAAAPAAEGEEK